MKKCFTILISILVLFTLTACNTGNGKDYTFVASEPDFGTQKTITKEFDDFSIMLPTAWSDQTTYFVNGFDQQNIPVNYDVLYGAAYPSDIGLYSNLSIIYYEYGAEDPFDIDYFDQAFANELADGFSEAHQTEVSADEILYGLAGNKETAIIYFSFEQQGIPVQSIIQAIPFDQGYYYITYTLFADEGRDDVEAIINSVKFK